VPENPGNLGEGGKNLPGQPDRPGKAPTPDDIKKWKKNNPYPPRRPGGGGGGGGGGGTGTQPPLDPKAEEKKAGGSEYMAMVKQGTVTVLVVVAPILVQHAIEYGTAQLTAYVLDALDVAHAADAGSSRTG
jgi:hypothetical protein